MTKKLLLISAGSILTTVAIGWEVVMLMQKHDQLKGIVAQAIPIIRFERFDAVRNALIIGLYNPGVLPMEISRTALTYETDHKSASADCIIKEYGSKPLVLDPGDTILVPLHGHFPVESKTASGNYWGQLDFQIPGQVDFYSMHHRFSTSEFDAINDSVSK